MRKVAEWQSGSVAAMKATVGTRQSGVKPPHSIGES